MENSEKDKIKQKWATILDSMGVTGSKSDWLAEYAQNMTMGELSHPGGSLDNFPSLLPIAMKVAARTISSDLIFASQEEINEVKRKVQTENRDGKIGAIIEGNEFTEKKLEDDEEYKELMKKGVTPMSGPSNNLFYLDFKYDSSTQSSI